MVMDYKLIKSPGLSYSYLIQVDDKEATELLREAEWLEAESAGNEN